MTTNPQGGLQGPQSDLTTAITGYTNTVNTQDEDHSYLEELLKSIVNRKNMTTGQAFMLTMMALMPQMVQVQGDGVGVQGAAQNVGSTCTQIVNQMVNDFSVLQNTTSTSAELNTAATDLTSSVNLLQNQLGSSQKWIDNATSSSITSALGAFSGMFSTGGFTVNNLITTVQQWANSPSGTSGRSADSENLQQSMGDLNQSSSAFASSTSIQGSVLQNQVAIVGQLMGAMKSLLQSLVTFNNSVNANMKGG